MPKKNTLGPVIFYSLQLPVKMKERIAGYARAAGIPESAVVREAIDTYLNLVTNPPAEEVGAEQTCMG